MEFQLKKKFPKGVLSFYTELYCKKKNYKCKKQEALKSWISLNKSEKKFLETKYKECLNRYKMSFALHLKNVEPYLKSKQVPSSRRNSLQNLRSNSGNNERQSKMDKIQEKNDNKGLDNHTPNIEKEENTALEFDDLEMSNILSPTSTSNEMISIPEPMAPKIITGKELFLINQEGDQNCLVWEELTKPQKRCYTDAVLAIKKNYIKKYSEYLEHLSSKELFHHHRNIVNSVVHEDWYKKNKP